VPRAPLPEVRVTPFRVVSPTTSKGATPSSSLLRAHAPDHHPPLKLRAPHLYSGVFAGCCPPLLDVGLSRRYLRASFPTCLDLYPGASPGAPPRFFPGDLGLHHLGIGSAPHNVRTATSGRGEFRDYQSFSPVQACGCARHPGRSYRSGATGQPWLLRPSILRFVASPYIGYACRPNRAIDGVGTCTPQDSRPCRPLPRGLRPKEPLRLQPHPSYAACPGRALSRAAGCGSLPLRAGAAALAASEGAEACGWVAARKCRWLGGGAKIMEWTHPTVQLNTVWVTMIGRMSTIIPRRRVHHATGDNTRY
jgi:hypothetical protein